MHWYRICTFNYTEYINITFRTNHPCTPYAVTIVSRDTTTMPHWALHQWAIAATLARAKFWIQHDMLHRFMHHLVLTYGYYNMAMYYWSRGRIFSSYLGYWFLLSISLLAVFKAVIYFINYCFIAISFLHWISLIYEILWEPVEYTQCACTS